jgi:hypothetical protein
MMEASILVTGLMGYNMAMGRWYSLMEKLEKDSLKMECLKWKELKKKLENIYKRIGLLSKIRILNLNKNNPLIKES